MIIAEILAGLVAISVGILIIFISAGADESRWLKNPFYDFLGISKLRQRAYGIVGGVGFCLVGLLMLFQGFGFLR